MRADVRTDGRQRPTTSRPAAPWLLPLVVAVVTLAGCGGGDTTEDQPEGPAEAASPTSTPAPTATGTGDGAPQPVVDQDFPDPDVLAVDGSYLAYATQPAYPGTNVQVARSDDLRTWEVLDTDPLPELGDWATTGRTWAPEVTAVGEGYVMYYTAHSIDPDMQCIGVATATDPLGPFEPVGDEPLVCPADAGGAIDAASFVDADGTRYLLWKNDGNCCGKDTWLHLQEVTPDGVSLAGPPVRLVRQDQPWEGDLVEAPTLVERDGTYVLLYSANSYGGDDYAIGYATAPALEGPYTKAPEPLLSTAGSGGLYQGPGGQDVVTSATGEDHLVFHDWDPAYVYRGIHVVPLTWDGATPVPRLPAPAG